jgi:hypothetical protein
MTFEEFQATRTDCADIGAAIGADMYRDEPVAGFLYHGGLYIEKHGSDGFYLLIEREDWISADLAELERKLFEFALAEGYVT